MGFHVSLGECNDFEHAWHYNLQSSVHSHIARSMLKTYIVLKCTLDVAKPTYRMSC